MTSFTQSTTTLDDANPVNLWRSIYHKNTEFWTQRMAELVQTDVVARALHIHLNNYLASSEPFRKIVEQYMEFLLVNFNMPSREEVVRLAQQVDSVDARLNEIDSKAQHIEQLLYANGAAPESIRATQPMPDQAAHESLSFNGHARRVDDLEARVHVLDTKLDQVLHLLQRQSTQHAAEPSSSTAGLQDHVQSLDDKAGQLLRILRDLHSPPDADAS
jgi:Mg2+ and Co2+ transporter CorA